jgi:fluoroquinolone transport system permease protein
MTASPIPAAYPVLKRLAATLACDIRIQFRNGFYYVSAFVVIMWSIIFTQVPSFDLAFWMPALLLGNLIINTFYFVGGLILLEKTEGTLEAQIVSPLKTSEYLGSKVTTLLLLSLLENFLITALIFGLSFRFAPWILGIATASAFYVLVGFLAVSKYDSINEYLMPSMLYTSTFGLPFVHYFGLTQSWLIYLHPLQAPLILLKGAFYPIETWQLIYGVLYSVLWIWIMYLWSKKTFFKYIVAREGRN